jgi:hypothetical protein
VSRHVLRRDEPVGARAGLLAAVLLTFGLGVVSCQALEDAPRRAQWTAGVPVRADVSRETRTPPSPTTTPTTPVEPYPGAWCGNRCRNGHLLAGDAPRSTAPRLTGHRPAAPSTARPAPRQPVTPQVHVSRETSARKTTAKTTAPAPPVAALARYANCAAVRAAGRAPIRAGQPGYSRKLDADGDGVGCEVS